MGFLEEKNMLRLYTEQHSKLWNAFREIEDDSFRVGASHMGILFEKSVTKKRRELIAKKLGVGVTFPEFVTPAMQKGIDQEPLAVEFLRFYFEDEIFKWVKQTSPENRACQMEWREVNTVLGVSGSHLKATPDAMYFVVDRIFKKQEDFEMYGIEIKTYKYVPRKSRRIYKYHYLQCQTCLEVTGADGWWLFYWNPEEPFKSQLFKVHRDERTAMAIRRETARFVEFLEKNKNRKDVEVLDEFKPNPEYDEKWWDTALLDVVNFAGENAPYKFDVPFTPHTKVHLEPWHPNRREPFFDLSERPEEDRKECRTRKELLQ